MQNQDAAANIFKNFTYKGKNAIRHAKNLATALEHVGITPIHVLYGAAQIMINQNSVMLKSHSLHPDIIKAFISSLSMPTLSKGSNPCIGKDAENLFESAMTLASSLDHKSITAEHLMICSLQSKSQEILQFLEANKNIDEQKASNDILDYIKTVSATTIYTPANKGDKDLNSYDINSGGGDRSSKPNTLESKLEILTSCGQNLTELAKAGKLQKITGREKEIASVMKILLRHKKNNPLLKGEPGVGKTSIAEGLAQAIADGNVPSALKDVHVVSIEMPSMVAGTKYRGQFEEKIKSIIEAAQDPKIIIVIDEIHTIVGAGSAEGAIDAGNILKPALSKGLKCIGATTFKDAKKTVEKDPALERRFSPVIVHPNTEEETIQILRGMKKDLEAHHRCKYSSEAIQMIPRLANRYMPDRQLPDKAVDIMDEAGAFVRIQSHTSKSALISLKAELKDIQKHKIEAIDAQNYPLAVDLRSKENALKMKIKQQQTAHEEQEGPIKKITSQIIAKTVASETGIPYSSILSSETQKLSSLKTALHSSVFGQDHAIDKMYNSLIQSKLGLKDPVRPSSFLLLGPTGVGKTHLAIIISSIYSDSPNSLIKIDMSEHMEKASVSKIMGANPGYVGHDETNTLADRVRKNPYSVVLFDEIEKAHPDILDILLQVLEDGRLTDSTGREVDFSHSFVIMTSNMGSQHFSETQIGFAQPQFGCDKEHDRITERVIKSASKLMRPELINRFDAIIVFKPLPKEHMKHITQIEIQKIKERLRSQFKKDLSVPENVISHIAHRGFDFKSGARSIRRTVQEELTNAISSFLINNNSSRQRKLIAEIKDHKIVISELIKKKIHSKESTNETTVNTSNLKTENDITSVK